MKGKSIIRTFMLVCSTSLMMKSGSKSCVETATSKAGKENRCRFMVAKLKERDTSECPGNDAKKTLESISYSN
jgi:hypothetical protein